MIFRNIGDCTWSPRLNDAFFSHFVQKSLVRRMQDLDPALKDQLYSFRDVEDEAYIICRWLRASNFNAKSAIQRLEENQPFFQEAKKHNFFPGTIGVM